MPKVKNYELGAGMAPDPKRAWFSELAVRRGFGSIRGLSSAVMLGGGGSSADLLSRVLKKRRKLQAAEVVRLAAALNAPVTEVLEKLGFDVHAPRAELAGTLDGSGSIRETEIRGDLPAPYYTEPLSVVMAATAGSPLSMWDKALLFFVDATELAHPHETQLCIIKIAERPERILGFVKSKTLITIAGALEPLETKQILAANPVRWVRFT